MHEGDHMENFRPDERLLRMSTDAETMIAVGAKALIVGMDALDDDDRELLFLNMAQFIYEEMLSFLSDTPPVEALEVLVAVAEIKAMDAAKANPLTQPRPHMVKHDVMILGIFADLAKILKDFKEAADGIMEKHRQFHDAEDGKFN